MLTKEKNAIQDAYYTGHFSENRIDSRSRHQKAFGSKSKDQWMELAKMTKQFEKLAHKIISSMSAFQELSFDMRGT